MIIIATVHKINKAKEVKTSILCLPKIPNRSAGCVLIMTARKLDISETLQMTKINIVCVCEVFTSNPSYDLKAPFAQILKNS